MSIVILNSIQDLIFWNRELDVTLNQVQGDVRINSVVPEATYLLWGYPGSFLSPHIISDCHKVPAFPAGHDPGCSRDDELKLVRILRKYRIHVTVPAFLICRH